MTADVTEPAVRARPQRSAAPASAQRPRQRSACVPITDSSRSFSAASLPAGAV